MGRVREVRVEKLAQDMAKENWDLVKVVLIQLITKILSYEVSFIALSGAFALISASPATQQPSLCAFKLKAEHKQDIALGSYYARKRDHAAASVALW